MGPAEKYCRARESQNHSEDSEEEGSRKWFIARVRIQSQQTDSLKMMQGATVSTRQEQETWRRDGAVSEVKVWWKANYSPPHGQ